MRLKHLRRFISICEAAALVTLMGNSAWSQTKLETEVNSYLVDLPFNSFSISLPAFPERSFDIRKFGAVGDGHTMNTASFRKAIDACSEAGGGTVIVPPGLWLTGPIELKSNVNLHVERGALILFSPNHEDYPIIKSPHRGFLVAPPIYGFNLVNIAITGTGLIDGNGTTWRPVKRYKVTESLWKQFVESGGVVSPDGKMWWPSEAAMNAPQGLAKLREERKKLTANDFLPFRDFLRPKLVFLDDCKRVLIDGVTLENSPAFAFNPNFCEDMVVMNVKVNNEYWAQNGDGIDIGSSKRVLVNNCTVTAGDDGICMKSDRQKNSKGPELENVVITNCVVYHAHGGFVTGSNTDGGMHNIYVHNCDYVGTDVGLRFKSARDRGGVVDNIYVRDIYMKDIVRQAILFDTYYEKVDMQAKSFPVTDRTPIFKDIHIDSLYCDGANDAALVVGLPEMPIQNVSISNAFIKADRGFLSDYATGFVLRNVKIVPKEGAIYSLNQTKDMTIDRGAAPAGTKIFMKVDGALSDKILIRNTGLTSVKIPIEYGPDANKNSVTQE